MCFWVSVGITVDVDRLCSHIEGHHTLVPSWHTFHRVRWYSSQRDTIQWFHATLDVRAVHSFMYALIDGDKLTRFLSLICIVDGACVGWITENYYVSVAFSIDLTVLFLLATLFV